MTDRVTHRSTSAVGPPRKAVPLQISSLSSVRVLARRRAAASSATVRVPRGVTVGASLGGRFETKRCCFMKRALFEYDKG